MATSQIANELSCNLYPNPATDFISIATPFEGNKVVTVYNAVGQAVKYTITNGTQFSVNTEELSKGFYFVNVREQNGLKTSILKFVKN